MNEAKDLSEKIKRLSVVYLLKNMEEVPEGLEKFFNKLSTYEKSIDEITSAMQSAERSLGELNTKREQTMGSINSMVELIIDELPNDKCLEWSEKGSSILNNLPNNTPPPVSKNEEVDMAGSTAKKVNMK